MLLVLILGSAVATIAFAGVGLAGSVSKSSGSREQSLQADWALNGAFELAKSDLFARRVTAGDTKTYTVGGKAILVNVIDNDSQMPNTVRLQLTATAQSRPIARTRVLALAKPVITSIWSHGIFSNSNFTWPAASSVNGSVYFRNSISVSSTGGQVSKDFKTTSMFNPMGLITVHGAILTGMTPYAWPTINSASYTGQATSVLTGSQVLNGYTFPVDNALVVVNGDLTLSNSTITRSGTLFVTGNVTVNRLVKANPNDHVMIVTPRNITFSGSGTVQADGYFFAGGQIAFNAPVTASGAMLANSYSGNKPLNITWDKWIMDDPQNGKTLKAPGLWP
jgi:hypothetical protein